jgi:hypothetical protein
VLTVALGGHAALMDFINECQAKNQYPTTKIWAFYMGGSRFYLNTAGAASVSSMSTAAAKCNVPCRRVDLAIVFIELFKSYFVNI